VKCTKFESVKYVENFVLMVQALRKHEPTLAQNENTMIFGKHSHYMLIRRFFARFL